MYCVWMHKVSVLALSVSPFGAASSPKVGAFGSPCKVYHYAKASPFDRLPGRGRWHEVPEGEQGGTAQAVTERASPLKKRTFFAFSPKTQLSCKKCYNFFLKKAVFPLTALL